MSLEFKSREVHINAIRVPWDNLPGADKIAKCYGFYRQHGFLDRVIVIDGQYWLRDGLAGLMVARAVGLKRVKVLQVKEKKDKPEPETDQPTSLKTPCDCYHERESGPHGVISECWGTREREECSCHGYRERCTFYPEHRKSPTTETGGSHETEV